MPCSITLTIAGKRFSHAMPYGYIKITMPRSDMPGRVPVRVTCAGQVATAAFTVK
jgi:hypothetical protein